MTRECGVPGMLEIAGCGEREGKSFSATILKTCAAARLSSAFS